MLKAVQLPERPCGLIQIALAHLYAMPAGEPQVSCLERGYEEHSVAESFIPAAPELGFRSFLTPLSRPGPSHRFPTVD